MPRAMECHECHQMFDDISATQEFCPNCCTDNVSTWVYEEA